MEIILFFCFFLALFIGSFLNVVIDRLPRGQTIIGGRSHCEHCKKTLAWYDLIPLISYLFLLGKCRYCAKPIDPILPVVEFTTGVVFVSVFIFVQKQPFLSQEVYYGSLIFYLGVFSSLIALFFIDLKYGILPDKIIFPLIGITLIYQFIAFPNMFTENVLSGIVGFGFFLLLFLVTFGKGMGFGDVKLALFMGIFLGLQQLAVALYIAFISGAIVALILVLFGKKKLRGSTMPFGPFLVLGTYLAFFYGQTILSIYKNNSLFQF